MRSARCPLVLPRCDIHASASFYTAAFAPQNQGSRSHSRSCIHAKFNLYHDTAIFAPAPLYLRIYAALTPRLSCRSIYAAALNPQHWYSHAAALMEQHSRLLIHASARRTFAAACALQHFSPLSRRSICAAALTAPHMYSTSHAPTFWSQHSCRRIFASHLLCSSNISAITLQLSRRRRARGRGCGRRVEDYSERICHL